MPVDRSLPSPVDRHPIFRLTQPADQLTQPPHQFYRHSQAHLS